MTNEDHSAEWELGDAITIHLDPEEPEADDADDADAATGGADTVG